MRKGMVVLAVCLACAAASGQSVTNANWSASVSLTQSVTAVQIRNVNIVVLADGKVSVTVGWVWLDAAGKVVRNGVSRYAEAEIAVKLAARGSSVEAFKSLFLAIAAEEAEK